MLGRMMNGQREAAEGGRSSQPTVPTQQDYLFVDAAQAKTSRQGRRNARSFVMQKARRERPWSTSKHVAKQRKIGSPENASPTTPKAIFTPKTATPSRPIASNRTNHVHSVEQNNHFLRKRVLCPECHIFSCRPGQRLCPKCLLLKPPALTEDPNNRLFDPFRTSSVEINRSVSELLEHCKYWPPHFCW